MSQSRGVHRGPRRRMIYDSPQYSNPMTAFGQPATAPAKTVVVRRGPSPQAVLRYRKNRQFRRLQG